MAFTKMGNFTFNHAEQPDKLNLPAAETKAKLDSRANELKTAFNAAVDLLNATAAGDSGADNVGAAAIDGIEGASVQAQMVGMKGYVDAHKADKAHIGLNQKCCAYNNANISIPHSSWTNVTLNSEYYDTDSMHSTSSNTERIIAPVTGIYLVVAKLVFSNTSTVGERCVCLFHNETDVGEIHLPASNIGHTYIEIVQVLSMTQNDYVKMQGWQNSGGALNIMYAQTGPSLALIRIG